MKLSPLVQIKAEIEELTGETPKAPEAKKLSDGRWQYPELNIRVRAATKEDADYHAFKRIKNRILAEQEEKAKKKK
jgi:hypothetical protein